MVEMDAQKIFMNVMVMIIQKLQNGQVITNVILIGMGQSVKKKKILFK